ncbi:MAG TPA: FliH/SctL family protein [Candidatus Acidoferrales bacterium]|nr:FliH/SctL family protein [Candidatus Acidoferrales bacterium]
MSTSPKLSPARSAPDDAQTLGGVQPFPYASIPPGASCRNLADGISAAFSAWGSDAGLDESTAREAQARAEGRAEGQAEARKVFEEQLARERASLAAALAQFTRDRAAYFPKIEGEVVQLALAIARKILHREAQVDPLLLAGIVRVGLEKIDGATGVRLRVHPQNAADWQRYLSTHIEPADLPEIVEDASQPPDCCALETSMGTATVGLEVQLKEVEQGLMDLLAARPGAAE